MNQMFPLREDTIQPFCGMPVCVIMHDGSRHVGILSSCKDGKVMLNAHMNREPQATIMKLEKPHSSMKKNKKGKKAPDTAGEQIQTQSNPNNYGPQPFYPWAEHLRLIWHSLHFYFYCFKKTRRRCSERWRRLVSIR
ncbi:hypothetical protein D3C78_772590 [compost metagenome]